MPRGLTIAIWVFAVNAMFTILKQINPFTTDLDYTIGSELINATTNSSVVGDVSFLGTAEILNSLNLFIDLILGPFTLVPQIMSMIGITGIVNTVLTGCIWFVYAYFIFQLITGRALGDVK